jgi:hypothetical protein
VVSTKMHGSFGVRSMAVFPLLVANEVVGTLLLYADEPQFFHDEEVNLLSELTSDVALAIDHIDKRERLDYLAYYDVLTGLANRAPFSRAYRALLMRRRRKLWQACVATDRSVAVSEHQRHSRVGFRRCAAATSRDVADRQRRGSESLALGRVDDARATERVSRD